MIYIHVGFPKTASTTIQHFLGANMAFLEQHKRTYPKVSPDRKSAYGVNPDAHNPLAVELRRGTPGPAWTRLQDIIAKRPSSQDIVLSGEALAGCNPETLRRWLGPEDATIIFYVREYAKIVLSQYAQRTKLGSSTANFDDFLDHQIRGRGQGLADHIAGWAPVFGARNIKVRQLDSRTLVRNDVRFDMLDAIGIDPASVDERELEMTEDANTSPGWKTLEILRDLNHSLASRFVADTDRRALIKARKDRRSRTESPLLDFTGFIARPAIRLGKQMGFNDRGLYMTEEQYEQCNTVFDAQVDALNTFGMDTRLAHAARDKFVPRTFMPSIEHVPAAEVAAFMLRLAPIGWWSLISGERSVGELIKVPKARDGADRFGDATEGDMAADQEE